MGGVHLENETASRFGSRVNTGLICVSAVRRIGLLPFGGAGRGSNPRGSNNVGLQCVGSHGHRHLLRLVLA